MPRLPPAEKLPLALRKNIRDEFEAKKPDFEKQLSDLLGVPWTIEVNPNAIHPYAVDDYPKERLGACIAGYIDSAISQIKYFESYHHEEGLKELNEICSAHVLTMDLDEDKKFNYCGAVVKDGKLAIVFNEKQLGTNVNDALERRVLLAALNEAPPAAGNTSKLSFAARDGIRLEWEPKVGEVQQKIGELLAKADIKLTPNWDETFAALAAEKKRKGNGLDDDWEQRLGEYTRSYFESVQSHLEYQKFGDDDMLQEGFHEAVDKGEIAFRIVDKLQYDSYCEVVVDGGVLYVQTLASKWGVNIYQAAQKIVDQL